jgi:ATP-dependent RNA helicase DDX5/DBP2
MEGYRSASIHGDKVQHARDNIIAMFKASVKNVMVATDVASRGLGNIFLALTRNRYQGYKICGQL